MIKSRVDCKCLVLKLMMRLKKKRYAKKNNQCVDMAFFFLPFVGVLVSNL